MDHKELAKACFNGTWDLLDKINRTEDEALEMIHMAHASVYHWKKVGTHLNLARGEWQVSRVYAILKLGESAVYHGEKCLDYCEANGFGDYDLAFAYESIARGYKILGDVAAFERYFTEAEKAGQVIQDTENKAYFFHELNTMV